MTAGGDPAALSRRAVLRASGGALGLLGAGTARAAGDEGESSDACSETTVGPSAIHYDDSLSSVCRDDHPETTALQSAVQAALRDRYPTVGSLIDDGFVPYFDLFAAGDLGWSHWLSPDHLRDGSVVDATRPESVLVDHKWWRPIGVMFAATRDGERVDPPPSVYVAEDDGGACTPWHAHVGLPGRYSWWKFRTMYARELGEGGLGLPCRTPWVMHVWRYDHPDSVYDHHAPPRENRGGPPAEDAGFETDAVPGEDALGPEVLPDAFLHKLKHLD